MNRIYLPRPLAALACCALLTTPALAQEIPSAAQHCAANDLVETTPSSDFTALDGGSVVRHEPTGLEWRRCPEGMDWTGSGCDGSATLMTWKEALSHADNEADWRMPNINELRSIVERCASQPAINAEVFPDTYSGTVSAQDATFWSSSPYVYGLGVADAEEYAWRVHFSDGSDAYRRYHKRIYFNVRLVRGGQ